MGTSRIASVLGFLSIGVSASLGACKSSSHANGDGDRSVSSEDSGSVGSSGSSGSGDSGGSADGAVDGSSSGGSSGVGSSSGAGSGAASGSSGGGSKPYLGLIAAVMQSDLGQSAWIGAAAFAAAGDAGGTAGCAGTQSGNCCYTPPGSAAASTPTYVSAGNIVVEDGSNTIATMSPVTDAGPTNAYATSNQQDTAYTWAAGDTLRFTAAGGTVDAFSGTVVAPGLMQNIHPDFSSSSSSTLMVQATSDFTFTWTPGGVTGDGSGIFVAAVSKSNAPDGSISCTGMDSAGSITLPQALLAKMTSGDTLEIVLTRLASSTVTTGNASVVITVGAETLGVGQLQ